MALQLRRGQNAQRATTQFAEGELVYVTDNLSAQVSPLYIGDGSTTGGVPVVRVVSVNGETGAIALDTNDIPEGATNKYYLAERAQDDVAAALAAGVHTGITFTYNTTPQDSGNRIDAVVAASGTVNSGTASALAYYAGTGTAVSGTVSLIWSETNNNLTISLGSLTVTAGNTGRSLADFNTSADLSAANAISFNKSRGQTTSRTAVIDGDTVAEIRFRGYDGAAHIRAAAISSTIEGTVSTGVVPGALSFFISNLSGVSATVVKINNATTGSNGLVAVTGTVKASVALQTAVFADNAARNLTIPVPSIGMITFNTATGKFEGNTDGTTGGWVALN